MKVYVVKNKYNKKTNGYMTETGDFINSIWQAELFNDYETAKCYAPALCQVVECELMEETELSNYTKQVRKEVCETIQSDLLDFSHSYWRAFKQNGKQYMTDDDIIECLDDILHKIQGE